MLTPSLVDAGANVNCSYGRTNPNPVLFYAVKNHHLDMAEWLLQHGAKPQCLLRWEYMVQKKILTPAQLFELMKRVGVKMSTRSDDGQKFNIMHYACYFGDVKTVQELLQINDNSLVNDITDQSDSALTIALLSPLTEEETKLYLASLLYPSSNLAMCNNRSQNAIQIVLLKGRIGLLFHMLPYAMNVRQDFYGNTMLHLAVKARLSTVARFILRFMTVDLDRTDRDGDTVLTLAVKSGDEELACEIFQNGADPTRVPKSWNMSHSERDTVLHQALKRDMQELGCELARTGAVLNKDTNGDFPIHIALNNQLDKVVEYLLTLSILGSFIDCLNDSDSDTPLHLALKLGFYKHAKSLIEHGANVNMTNKLGLTPCHVLVMVARGDYQSVAKNTMTPEEIVNLLDMMLAQQPDLEIVNYATETGGHETCLHMAIHGGEVTKELVRRCLAYEPKLVQSRDFNDATPLILAVQNGDATLVRELCDAGCDLNVMNKDRDTPLHIAVGNGDVDIVGDACFECDVM